MATDEEVRKKLYACKQRKPRTLFGDWYVGVAKDPRERLFTYHGVDEAAGDWAFEEAESPKAARRIARSFHDGAGFDGEVGEPDPTALHVYVYLKTSNTRERRTA